MKATPYMVGTVRWLAEDAEGICAHFGFGPERLPDWHARMAEKEMFFKACCRTWGVRELSDMNAAHMRPWEDRLIADELACAVDAVADLRVRAVSWWKKGQSRKAKKAVSISSGSVEAEKSDTTLQLEILTHDETEVQRGSDAAPASAQTGVPPGRQDLPPAPMPAAKPAEVPAPPQASGEALSEKEIARLKRYGFGTEEAPEIRAYLLERFADMHELLESSSDRSAVMKMLSDEVTLFFVTNEQISHLRAQIRSMGAKATGMDQDKLQHQLDAADKLQKAIEKAKESLGIGEGESGGMALGKGVRANASYLIQAHWEYYAKDENARLDGVFNEAELTILLKPFGDRIEQYRGELPLIAAQVAETLWSDRCDPVLPNRAQQRKLRKHVRAVALSLVAESGGIIEDLADDGDEEAPAPGATGVQTASAQGSAPAPSEPAVQAWTPQPAGRATDQVFV